VAQFWGAPRHAEEEAMVATRPERAVALRKAA
jgi:hypothetical protein